MRRCKGADTERAPSGISLRFLKPETKDAARAENGVSASYHRPAIYHIAEARINLSMVGQRQRRISGVSRSKRTQHDLMAAAGIAERSHSGRSVEVGRVRLEPANPHIHVADR